MTTDTVRSAVTTVYLVRHGRTAYNADGRLRGLSDPPLDERGRAEAHAVAVELAGRHLAAIIASPLQRAVATADAIAKASGLHTEIDSRLVDRDYGEWTGQLRREVEQRFGSIDDAPGVEPAAELAERALAAFFAITGEQESGPIVLVAHDAFNRALLRGIDPTLTEIHQPTGGWSRLDLIAGRWRAVLIGRTPC